MIRRIFAGENSIEMLSAPVAANHHCDGELPIHKRVVLLPNEKTHSRRATGVRHDKRSSLRRRVK